MSTWNSSQYLKFANERTQPSIDLAARLTLDTPARIIDLGCGPGNSTASVARRYPTAAITGLDSSPDMLVTAAKVHPEWTWQQASIEQWAEAGTQPGAERYDLVFSNAALHWVTDHATSLPKIFARVAPGGALAFQMPHSLAQAHQSCMRALPNTPKWRAHFPTPPDAWQVEPVGFYYDLFARHAARVHLWLTEYIYVFDGVQGIVEWHRGAALRPFLARLPDDAARAEFLADYLAAIAPHYPPQANGKVLLPFRRLFVIAYR